MPKSKRSSQLDQDISEILSNAPSHDSTRSKSKHKVTREKKTTNSQEQKLSRKSTEDISQEKHHKGTKKKSTKKVRSPKKDSSFSDSSSNKDSKKDDHSSSKRKSNKVVAKKQKSIIEKRSARSSQKKTKLPFVSLFQDIAVYTGKFLVTSGIAGFIAGSTLMYISYTTAQKDVQQWLNPEQNQILQSEELGRLYSAPLSYWSGLPFSMEEVTEDLRMAGYDNVDFHKVQQKGDFGYSKEKKQTHIVLDDGKHIFIHFTASEISKIVDENQTSVGIVELRPLQLAEFRGKDNRTQKRVSLEEIPSYVPAAVLAVEDSRFYDHVGIDIIGLIRAIVVNIVSDSKSQGASTITQQLVKNLILENSSKTYERKLKEVFRAVALENAIYDLVHKEMPKPKTLAQDKNPQLRFQQEQEWEAMLTKKVKDRIIEMYLNEVYLGHSNGVAIYGVEQAARTFFGKSASKLDIDEAAMLAGLISSPNTYSPIRHPEKALVRRNIGLLRLEKTGIITEEERKRYEQRELQLDIENFGRRYPWFVTQAMSYVPEDVMQSGLENKKIYSSIHPTYQRIAEKAVSLSLEKLELVYPESKGVQIALVSLHARTGNVLAMVGGRDFSTSQFNRTTQANRSVGSIIKPLMTMFAMDLDSNISPGCFLQDTSLIIKTDSGDWAPKNYDGTFTEVISLRDTIRTSRNIPMVNLYMDMQNRFGTEWLYKPAQQIGLKNITKYPSASLGGFSATPLEIAGAYTTVAAEGIFTKPRFVTQIASKEEGIQKLLPESERISKATSAWMTRDMMVSVMENGTAIRAKSFGIDGHFAGKTGTTNAGRDAWFIGFDRDIITVVWVGFDDSRSLGLTGGKAAIPTWSRYNDWLNLGRYPFLPNSSLSAYDVCKDKSCTAMTKEWFVDGYGPARRMNVLQQLWGTVPNSKTRSVDHQCKIGDVHWEIDGMTLVETSDENDKEPSQETPKGLVPSLKKMELRKEGKEEDDPNKRFRIRKHK